MKIKKILLVSILSLTILTSCHQNEHTELFDARIKSNVTILNEKVASISFEGDINDNGLYNQIFSSLTYDIHNGEVLYLFDVVDKDYLVELIKTSDLEIYPEDFEDKQDIVKEIFVEKISNTVEYEENIVGFFLTEEYIVLYTYLSPKLKEHIIIKAPYIY